jgi:hypothetical protein
MSQSPVTNAIGWLLVVLGGLWLVLTGGCTLLWAGAVVVAAFQTPSGGLDQSALTVAAIGAVCIAPGAVMFWLGRRLLKRSGSSTDG